MKLSNDVKGALMVVIAIFAIFILTTTLAAEETPEETPKYSKEYLQGYDAGVQFIRDACYSVGGEVIDIYDKESGVTTRILCMAANINVVRNFIREFQNADKQHNHVE